MKKCGEFWFLDSPQKFLCVLHKVLIHTKNPPVFEFCIRVKPRFMSFLISVTFGIFIKAEIKLD